jgi:hypothetical protein
MRRELISDEGLVDRAGPTSRRRHGRRWLGRVVVLLFAARRAVLHLALLPGLDDDLEFTEAALDLRQAVEELEGAHAGLPLRTAAVDLGEAPLDQVGACRAAVTGLLIAALDTVGRLQSVGAGELDTPEVLALGRVSQLVASAHLRVAGRLP